MKNNRTAEKVSGPVSAHRFGAGGAHGPAAGAKLADRLPLPEVTYVDWAEWERASLLAKMGIDLTGAPKLSRAN